MLGLQGAAGVAVPEPQGSMAELILLEDEPVLREELAEFLAAQDHRITATASVAAFWRTFEPEVHRIAVVDLGLPDGDGLSLIADLRRQGHRTGIIVLTARGTTGDKVAGLAGGADHYLPKTADLAELAATVEALARRLEVQAAPRWTLRGSPPELVPPCFTPIPLSAQDYTVLLALATGGECVTREAIVQALGGDYLTYDQRRLDTQMRRLRRKVEDACGLDLPVTTLRRVGFRFHAAVDVVR